MLTTLFFELKRAGVPVSLKEHLALLEGLNHDLANRDVGTFYYLARASLVKDERHIDKFDRVFSRVFQGVETTTLDGVEADIPEDWLRAMAEKHLTDDEKAAIEALGGFEKLMETLRERLAEQTDRHEGGDRWIGTGGTSPFGAYGYNPEGVRIGQDRSRHKRAVKVWDKREFKNLDDTVEIGVRNIKMALRRLRRFARDGAADEFDLDATIDATARQGLLDVKMRPERRNAVKLLMFFDVGGSMDPHIRVCEELFSGARSEFKTLEHFYFHNCLYEYVWKDNRRRRAETIPTWDVLHTYGADYRVIVVGDAAMSPYEITHQGAASEFYNKEAGSIWLQRLAQTYERLVWLNPEPEYTWDATASNVIIRRLIGERMFPLTLEGLDRAINALRR